MKQPELVNATKVQLDELLALAKASFPPPQYELLKGVLSTFAYVMPTLQNTRASIKRLRQMLFGARTESKRNLPGQGAGTFVVPPQAEGANPDKSTAEGNHKAKPTLPAGHGRNGADKYCDSPVFEIDLTDLKPRDICPECSTGKLYDSPPGIIVKVVGQPPLTATIYKLQKLRCNLCDAIFTAPMPAGVCATKYDHSCETTLALIHYGYGFPFYRLECMQNNLNVPLSDSTQWGIISKASPVALAVFGLLTHTAAQADLLHCDDTPGKILSLIDARSRLEAAGETPTANAINTTGIIAILSDGHRVALYFTGHPHAGQNLSDILAQRSSSLEPPIQMSDALPSNFVSEFERIVAKCMAHGRRKFVEVIENFPQACSYVIDVLANVYANDAHCRGQKMLPDQRLLYHQAHSAKPMQELKLWINAQFDQRIVEPNSGLGKCLNYLINHWEGLTLFLRMAGAPLDNNICEQALKLPIRFRNNSLFYKTTNGAKVGDAYMSIIHTCKLCRINPFKYLLALHSHAKDVMALPALWLPWNYHKQLAGA